VCDAVGAETAASMEQEKREFQFQCGAIEAALPRRRAKCQTLFQFQCGAIEAVPRSMRVKTFSKISIPVWCD